MAIPGVSLSRLGQLGRHQSFGPPDIHRTIDFKLFVKGHEDGAEFDEVIVGEVAADRNRGAGLRARHEAGLVGIREEVQDDVSVVIVVRTADLACAVAFEIFSREAVMRMVLDLIVGASAEIKDALALLLDGPA